MNQVDIQARYGTIVHEMSNRSFVVWTDNLIDELLEQVANAGKNESIENISSTLRQDAGKAANPGSCRLLLADLEVHRKVQPQGKQPWTPAKRAMLWSLRRRGLDWQQIMPCLGYSLSQSAMEMEYLSLQNRGYTDERAERTGWPLDREPPRFDISRAGHERAVQLREPEDKQQQGGTRWSSDEEVALLALR